MNVCFEELQWLSWEQGSWGQHGAHRGRQAPWISMFESRLMTYLTSAKTHSFMTKQCNTDHIIHFKKRATVVCGWLISTCRFLPSRWQKVGYHIYPYTCNACYPYLFAANPIIYGVVTRVLEWYFTSSSMIYWNNLNYISCTKYKIVYHNW